MKKLLTLTLVLGILSAMAVSANALEYSAGSSQHNEKCCCSGSKIALPNTVVFLTRNNSLCISIGFIDNQYSNLIL